MRLPTLAIAVVCWLSLRAVDVLAQGMGDETVLSRLGDPVEVEIDVRDWQHLDLARVQVVNATPQQYAAFGLTYQPVLDTLGFNLVGPNAAGEVKILVSSRDPVAEPFLELLLALRWPEGSALREYVLLFDPPLPEPQLSTVAEADAVVGTSPSEAAEPPRIEVPLPIEPAPAPEPPAREAAGRREYRVQDGDTLQTIAGRFMPGVVVDNVYQLLLGLHQLNPDAFIDGNITLLRSDALLQIPSTRDMAAINPLSAQQVFDQRWLEGLRSQQEPPPPMPAAEPALPPGTELASVTQAPSALLPAPAVAVVPQDAVEALAAEELAPAPVLPLASDIVAQAPAMSADSTEPVPAPVASEGNAALQQITSQAESIRNLLLVRQQRLAAVEQQILVLRSQLQQAGSQAGGLQRGVEQGSEVIREAVMLGLVAALLLIALAFTVVTMLRWAHELSGYRR